MSKKSEEKEHTDVLAYRSEEDRCYGLAGMTIALASLDAIDKVVRVSVDEAGPMVLFSNEFFWGSSQSASPKAQWQTLMQNYRITASLAMCNVLARCLVRERGADPTDMLSALYPAIESEGKRHCDLEDDEIQQIYESILHRARRIFGNVRLHPIVEELARIISRRRTLSGREIAEELHYLRLF